MEIQIATDHAGFEHKQAVVAWLLKERFVVIDHGALSFDAEDDFPDYISKAAEAVSKGGVEARGIIFGGSGQGEAMLANRYPNVRAAVFYGGDESLVTLSREHNNANILSIGARFTDIDTVKRVIWSWLHAEPLTDTKYARRNQKIEAITKHIHV